VDFLQRGKSAAAAEKAIARATATIGKLSVAGRAVDHFVSINPGCAANPMLPTYNVLVLSCPLSPAVLCVMM
jgi:flavin-binding protein dodecin